MIKKIGSVLLEIVLVLLIIAVIFGIVMGIMIYNGKTSYDIAFIDVFEPKKEEKIDIVKPRESNVVLTIPVTETETTTESLSQNYYYSQLNNYSKTIYGKLYTNKENLKTGNYRIDFGSVFDSVIKQSNGEEELVRIFQSAWDAFSYDNVDVFYIDLQNLLLITESKTIFGNTTHYISIGSNAGGYLAKGFNSKEQVDAAQRYVDNLVNEIISNTKGYSDYEKIKYVHDWMIDNLEYDTTVSKDNIRNIYGAAKNRSVVCEGYAKLFKYIMDKMKIQCVLISGTARNNSGNSEAHAWNYVNLGGKWYGVDTTWDDPIIQGYGTLSDRERYRYFLKGGNSFNYDHTPEGKFVAKSIEFKFPTLSNEDY